MATTPKDTHYKTYGKNHGYALVFLHGYLESSDIWDGFADLFSDEYFVICVDLPGHGKSPALSEPSTIDAFADAVVSVTDHLGIQGFHLVGHSMGGYVAMAMLEKYSEHLNSVVLLHSACYSDSDEKRQNRDREIELVKRGKKEKIFNLSIPRLYADENLTTFSQQVETSKKMALNTNNSGIVAALTAMKTRPDRSLILKETKIPVLLIGGRKDNLIPFETMEKMKLLSPELKLVCLENSGHMGFIEERENAAKELKEFFEKNFECL
jgi:pimeloyl-ACP methyl ester carboxylesterase